MSYKTIWFNLLSRLTMGFLTFWLAISFQYWFLWMIFAVNVILVIGWMGQAYVLERKSK